MGLKKTKEFFFSLPFVCHSLGKGRVMSLPTRLMLVLAHVGAMVSMRSNVHKRIVLMIMCLPLLGMFPSVSLGQSSSSKTHYTYIDNEQGLGDIFYKNSAYYRCLTQTYCQKPENVKPEDPPYTPKKLAIFLKQINGRKVIPSFLQCHDNGNSMVSMAEDLIPIVNEAVTSEEKCVDVAPVEGVIPQNFVDDTLKALQGYDKKCKREDRSCFQQVVDGLETDLANMFSLFGGPKSETTKMGCLSTLVSNVVESLYSTLKLFLWDVPKAGFNLGKNLWNYMFDEESETSTAMVYGSVLPENLAEALADWDLAKFYEIVRKNFLNFLGSIRDFYSELLGCSEWSGVPYQSECLKKTNWSCPTCESVMNFTCGLAGQLGTGFMLGGVLGTTKSIMAMSQMKKAISLNPKKYGLSTNAVEEIGAKAGIQNYLNEARESAAMAKYRVGKAAKPVTNVLSTIGDEMKFVFGMGTAFKKFISANPVTLPYHLTFQAGKNAGFKAMNNVALDRGYFSKGSTALNLGRKYALRIKNIQEKYQKSTRELWRIRGNRFNQAIYDDIMEDFLSSVKKEMEQAGVKVTKLPDGHGLKLEKGGEAFDYRPNFKARMDKQSANVTNDDFNKNLTFDDPFLDERNVTNLPPQRPAFLQDMFDKASGSKEIYTIKGDGMDGLLYLGHFTGQQNSVPKVTSCNDLLHDVEPLQIKEIQGEVATEAVPVAKPIEQPPIDQTPVPEETAPPEEVEKAETNAE